MEEKSKILIIGGTGRFGKFIVEASLKAGHSTFVLIRASAISNPARSELIESFENSGVTLLQGDLHDHESLVNAIKQIDVVISSVGSEQISDQVKIISAIKEVGTVKRFFPSEFGTDVDRANAVEPASSMFRIKAQIRRAVEAEGIPYTFVACNYFARYVSASYFGRWFFPNGNTRSPPRDKVVILGDGNAKAIFVEDKDICTYTVKAVDDPRTLNKILYMRPPANILSLNKLFSLWETKIGKTVEKVFLPEDQLLKNIKVAAGPLKNILAVNHCIFVKGVQTNFEIDHSSGAEASQLYPEVKYTTMDEFLNQLV